MNADRSIQIRGDPSFRSPIRPKRSAPGRGRLRPFLCNLGLLSALWTAMGITNIALSEHVTWHQQSHSYTIHLGVVPASVAAQDKQLVAIHEAAPHGAYRRGPKTHHVLVTVFKNPSGARLTDANVVAEVVESDLIHVKRKEKPLEMMSMAGGVTYCNFFDLHWNGEYRIHVRIQEPGRRSEEVTFLQKAYDLPK